MCVIMLRTKRISVASVGMTVTLRKGLDLSDRFQACSTKLKQGYIPKGIRGTVVDVDPESKAVQVEFPAVRGVGREWIPRSMLRPVKLDR